jgi:hypothetical protein
MSMAYINDRYHLSLNALLGASQKRSARSISVTYMQLCYHPPHHFSFSKRPCCLSALSVRVCMFCLPKSFTDGSVRRR